MAHEKTLGWQWDNTYNQLPELFYTKLQPESVRDPQLVICNEPLATALGLRSDQLHSQEAVATFAGQTKSEHSDALAQAYAGHQFGHFTMLGDGRAILLGEQVTPQGERWDVQLKGAGRTPYSRGGDGRAALGPMLREYVISEAMHALGIPTTRGLAVVTTGESVIRERDYAGAILTRVAASHLRVGTFQFAAAYGTTASLHALADYAIKRHCVEGTMEQNVYQRLLETVIHRQAQLIAKWQLVGFVHGVMNTDNMTISGETIDYGPCAFMDTYHPETVFSSIDQQGRYAYGNQPNMGGWNLARFAEALLPLLHDDENEAVAIAQAALDQYPKIYHNHWLAGMRAKLGLFNESSKDEVLIDDLLQLMQTQQVDYTNTFVALTQDDTSSVFCQTADFSAWYDRWRQRLNAQDASRSDSKRLMQENNPTVIPRNHLVEAALDAAVEKGDYKVLNQLLKVLTKPYTYTKGQTTYQTVPKRTTPYQTYCGT